MCVCVCVCPQAISFYIGLFPALDVASAFPLNAITLVRLPLGHVPVYIG
jgi:hypothetical protein